MNITYKEFVTEVFEHSIVVPAWYWGEDTVLDKLDSSKILLKYSTTMLREFGIIGQSFSMGQINQGLWLLFGPALGTSLTACMVDLYNPNQDIDVSSRLESIKSIYHVYADFVITPQTEVLETCFDMWWDIICFDFWKACERSRVLSSNEKSTLQYQDLNEDEKLILDTIFETLLKILALDDENCHEYALHGIGHSRHPKRVTTVQAILDQNLWPIEYVPWLESCRDGTVL